MFCALCNRTEFYLSMLTRNSDTGPIPEGETFFCPHCGALYAVTRSRLSDANIAKCVVCLHTMEERESTKVPIYKLVQRPEDA
jgi:predicted Zn finger-like uncharacterized protein